MPRFELGNRNAERIRCFILGFQVAERLAAWNNIRYGCGRRGGGSAFGKERTETQDLAAGAQAQVVYAPV